MKKIFIISLAAIVFTACKTERQTQLQRGNVVIENGHIYFDAIEAYKPIPKDTTLSGFRVRNTSVRKTN